MSWCVSTAIFLSLPRRTRLSITDTLCPFSRRWSATCEPMNPQPPVTSTCKTSISFQFTTSWNPSSCSATTKSHGKENRPALENREPRVSNGGPERPSEMDREKCSGSEQKLRDPEQNAVSRHRHRDLHRAASANRYRGWI